MGISSALLELVYMRHDTYVFSTGDIMDFYYQYIPTIHDIESLEKLMEDKDYKKQVYAQLVSSDDIRKSYTEFFDKL